MKYRLTLCTFFAMLSLLLNVTFWLPEAVAQNVDFPDSNLAAAVRGALGLGVTDPIPQTNLAGLTQLEADNAGITNLTGLEQATGLTTLYLSSNRIVDVSPLSGLTNLTFLSLGENRIVDVSPLLGLTNLTWLDLEDNQIRDIRTLANWTNLGTLNLRHNQISNLSPLSGLTTLTTLTLGDNQITDIGPLSGLTNLRLLGLATNQITDIRPLIRLTNLRLLGLAVNQITNIRTLADLTNLGTLGLGQNQISDLRPLAGLTSLTWLDLGENQISDLRPLARLTSLTWLDLRENQISDLRPLAGLTNLTVLDIGGNQISDLSPLDRLTNLTELNKDNQTIVIDPPPPLRIVLRPSPVAQDCVIFNEIHNAEDEKNDWIELKNISDEPVALKDWEISIVTPSEIKMVNRAEAAGKDEAIVAFPDYTLPVGGILLIVNTAPSETQLEVGHDITDPAHDPDIRPQYLIAPQMRLPDTPYLLILRSARNKNGQHEAFEDLAGNYFRSSVYYGTHIWPLRHTFRPFHTEIAQLTQGEVWRRTDVDARGYLQAAWTSSGHQSGIGYKPDVSFEKSLGTPGYPNDTVADIEPVGRITVSEVMFATEGGLFSTSQWIELYNNTSYATLPVNLEGWKLAIEARDSNARHRYSVFELEALEIATNQTVLLVTRDRKNAGNLPEDRIYDLYDHHGDVRKLGLYENKVLGWHGFGLRLYSPDGTLVDVAGNLDGKRGRDTPKWELPSGRTEDSERTSLIRQYQNNMALDGMEATSWVRAADMVLPVNTYYGHKTDIGTPGYRAGGPAPVMLSHLRADWTDAGVIVEWTTASELNNAGFNILRSQTRKGAFVKVNPTLILGAGTTAEQNTYTWMDTTAKLNVAYYYRIEDVSLDGTRQRSVAVRLWGHLLASGKLLETWADLKRQK